MPPFGADSARLRSCFCILAPVSARMSRSFVDVTIAFRAESSSRPARSSSSRSDAKAVSLVPNSSRSLRAAASSVLAFSSSDLMLVSFPCCTTSSCVRSFSPSRSEAILLRSLRSLSSSSAAFSESLLNRLPSSSAFSDLSRKASASARSRFDSSTAASSSFCFALICSDTTSGLAARTAIGLRFTIFTSASGVAGMINELLHDGQSICTPAAAESTAIFCAHSGQRNLMSAIRFVLEFTKIAPTGKFKGNPFRH